MYKHIASLVIYRYEVIIAVIILLLTGSVSVSSKYADRFPQPFHAYPYAIALTFDDGPHPYYTDAILSILRDNGVPGTFFVVGTQVLKYPYLARSLALNGHEVDIHSLTHRNLSRLSDEDIRTELIATEHLIHSSAGQDSVFFRPPGGQYTERVVQVARGMGLDMVLWSVFPRDHEENDPKAIVQRVLDQSRDGGVILLHSGRRPTLEALPRIISELRARGFRFVTVRDLRKQKGA